MEQRILGIDPGLAILGFGVIDCNTDSLRRLRKGYPAETNNNPVQLLEFGVIRTPAKTETGKRLCTLHDDLHSLIDQWKPDLVAIEKFFFYRMSSTILVAQARGVVMLALAQKSIDTVEFTPSQVKLALTGRGNAKKYEVQEAVASELDLEHIPRPDDAADALAIALTAWFDL